MLLQIKRFLIFTIVFNRDIMSSLQNTNFANSFLTTGTKENYG